LAGGGAAPHPPLPGDPSTTGAVPHVGTSDAGPWPGGPGASGDPFGGAQAPYGQAPQAQQQHQTQQHQNRQHQAPPSHQTQQTPMGGEVPWPGDPATTGAGPVPGDPFANPAPGQGAHPGMGVGQGTAPWPGGPETTGAMPVPGDPSVTGATPLPNDPFTNTPATGGAPWTADALTGGAPAHPGAPQAPGAPWNGSGPGAPETTQQFPAPPFPGQGQGPGQGGQQGQGQGPRLPFPVGNRTDTPPDGFPVVPPPVGQSPAVPPPGPGAAPKKNQQQNQKQQQTQQQKQGKKKKGAAKGAPQANQQSAQQTAQRPGPKVPPPGATGSVPPPPGAARPNPAAETLVSGMPPVSAPGGAKAQGGPKPFDSGAPRVAVPKPPVDSGAPRIAVPKPKAGAAAGQSGPSVPGPGGPAVPKPGGPSVPRPPAAVGAPPSAPKPPAKAAAKSAPKKKGRNKLVLLAGGVVVLAGVAYGAGLVMNHSDVPQGTTVLGVDIGGSSKEQAVQKLDAKVGDRATAPLKVVIGGKKADLKPSVAGLSIDTQETVRSVSGRDYNPVTVVGSLVGSGRTGKPMVNVDEEKVAAALKSLAGESGGAKDGTIRFVPGKAVPVYGKPYQGVDVAKGVEAVAAAYRERVETGKDAEVSLPTTSRQPKVSNAEVDRMMEEFAKPAMSDRVTIQTDLAHRVQFGPAFSLPQILTVKEVGGKLVETYNLEAIKKLYGKSFDGVLITRGNGSKTPVTPNDVAAALGKALRGKTPAERLVVIKTNVG
ncbi:hypothetical protein, partial [Streptomyces huiliensis]|uniref:hypothetical protein n=1 Tax=Streptomyces huiliensis TaxID=2876027 RepID=UPI001CBF72CA